MKYIIIDSYREFQCVGAECPDTCCVGWNVDIDAKTAQRYRQLQGEFGQKLRDNLEERNGRILFRMPGGICPFLTEDRLCKVYQELGPEHMCDVCKTYPRVSSRFGDIIISTLTLSCPEAVRLLMEHEGKVQFDFAEDDRKLEEDNGTDWNLFNKMVNGLTISMDIVQNRNLPFPVRIRLMFLFQAELQGCIRQNKDMDALKLLFSEPENYLPLVQKLDGYMRNDMEKVHSFAQFMNIAREMKYLELFYQTVSNLVEQYSDHSEEQDFSAWFEQLQTQYDVWYENYCVYYLIRHYMEALKTGDVLGKTQELIWMLNLQQCTMMAELAFNNGTLNKEKHIWIVSHLSRMFEHNKKNLGKVREELINAHEADPAYWLSMI